MGNGPRTAFKDIVAQIEQRNGIRLLGETNAMEVQKAPSDAELAVVAELKKDMAAYCGSPVIDRRQRQAVLRRRSAALPMGSFSRLSLMARRSSMVARKLSMDSKEMNAGFTKTAPTKTRSEDSDGDGPEDAEMEQASDAVAEALDVPTPNRS